MSQKTAADPCHLVECQGPQEGSSRWVAPGFPRRFPDTWVPAFPHKGTYRDVEKIKHLLKILARVFHKGSPTCTPLFHIHSLDATLATSDQTAEEDSLHATLNCKLQILKQLESFLVENCVPPTVQELRIYGLILWHIESCMLLYVMEENSKQDVVPMELLDHAVTSFLADNRIDVDETVLESFDDLCSDFFDVWNGFGMLLSLLENCVSSISKASSDEGVTEFGPATCSCTIDTKTGVAGHISTFGPLIVTKNADADTGLRVQESEGSSFDFKKTTKKRKLHTSALSVNEMTSASTESGSNMILADERVELLLTILRGLHNIGKMRSYAPPLPEEMKYYRLMWAHVMFILGFINSKCKAGKLPALPGGERDWVFIFCGQSFEHIDSVPDGWKMAVALGAIPDLIMLIKVCENHLSDNFANKASVNRGSVVESDSESKRTEQRHHIHGFDTVTADLDFGKLLAQNDEKKTPLKSRIECLHEILCILKNTNWNDHPTTKEQRLCARVVDHIHSSIWMYESEIWTRKEHLPSWISESSSWIPENRKPQARMDASMKEGDFVVKEHTTDSDVTDGREKTREQCLHEIVLLVEAIESSFLDYLPTAQEMNCYQEIQQQMGESFLQTTRPLMTQIFPGKSHLQLHHIALMDYHVKYVLDLERKALKLVDEECRKVLATIIPNMDWDCGKQFVGAMSREDEVALKAFLEGQLCGTWMQKSLDVAIRVLDSARMCADRVFQRLHDAEEKLYHGTQSMQYEKVMDEVCHVPGVLGSLFSSLTD